MARTCAPLPLSFYLRVSTPDGVRPFGGSPAMLRRATSLQSADRICGSLCLSDHGSLRLRRRRQAPLSPADFSRLYSFIGDKQAKAAQAREQGRIRGFRRSYGVVTARAGAAEGVNTSVPSRVTAAGPQVTAAGPQVTAAGPMFAAAAAPTARPVRGGDRMRNGSP